MKSLRQFLPTLLCLLGALASPDNATAEKPQSGQAARLNIVWILGEDASPHLGCYGETLIKTPHLDQLAAEGIRFENAFVTCPVCSPSRSAMVTGMYQTTLGTHNHRSQNSSGKGGGYPAYLDSYELEVR